MPFVRFADLTHLVRQHLPVPAHVAPPEHVVLPEHVLAPDHVVVPEHAVVPEQVVDVASEVGKEALGLGADLLKDQAQDQAQPDPTPWLWDHDPFTPGLQLTSDPLLVDIGDHGAVAELLLPDLHHLPDLPDDGLHTALG